MYANSLPSSLSLPEYMLGLHFTFPTKKHAPRTNTDSRRPQIIFPHSKNLPILPKDLQISARRKNTHNPTNSANTSSSKKLEPHTEKMDKRSRREYMIAYMYLTYQNTSFPKPKSHHSEKVYPLYLHLLNEEVPNKNHLREVRTSTMIRWRPFARFRYLRGGPGPKVT